MDSQQQTITEARALADRLDGLRSFGPEHFSELQAAVNTIRHLTVLLSSQAQDAKGPVKAGRCRFFGFGTAPQAAELGYFLARTIEGTEQELRYRYGDRDVILVRGARVESLVNAEAYEYAVFVSAPCYVVMSKLKTQDWRSKANSADLDTHCFVQRGLSLKRTYLIQDGAGNALQLTQHEQNDLVLDSSEFNAGQHAIADQLVKIGVLQLIPSDGKSPAV